MYGFCFRLPGGPGNETSIFKIGKNEGGLFLFVHFAGRNVVFVDEKTGTTRNRRNRRIITAVMTLKANGGNGNN